jgi:hypothetical protein
MRIHDAAHAAIDSTGGSTTAALRSQVMGLNDPTLGSRTTGLGAGPGTLNPVGSASLAQAGLGGVPSAVQNAITNLGSNIQTGTLASILNQVLHGIGGGSANQPSPSQEALFRAQTAQINSQMATQALPGQIQQQINSNTAAHNANMRNNVLGISPAPFGSYEGSAQQANDRQFVDLVGNQNFARQAASGWVNPVTY